MDFRHLIVTCLFSMLRLSFETQKIKENYAIFLRKTTHIKKLLHIFAASKTANSAIFVYNIRLQRSRKNNSFLHDFTRNAKM